MKPTQPQRTTVFFLLSLLVPLLMAALSCDAIGKPSAAFPSDTYDNMDDLWAACQERAWEIDDWVDREERKLEDEWLDGGDLLRLAVKHERVEEEAATIKAELHDNCQATADREFPIDSSSPKGLPPPPLPNFEPRPKPER